MGTKITYSTSNDVSWRAILALFRRNEWREWYSPSDTRYLLSQALLVASAWHGKKSVGIAVLWGDGRFYARLDTLLVDESYQRQGIGAGLVELVIARVDDLCPHYFELDTHEEWMVRFYERFGFEKSDGLWLDHRPTSERLVKHVEKRRRKMTVKGTASGN